MTMDTLGVVCLLIVVVLVLGLLARVWKEVLATIAIILLLLAALRGLLFLVSLAQGS